MTTASSEKPRPILKREVGVLGATMMGLGSIIGTGVFVSIGIAAGAAGPAVVLAIAVAAAVAAFNGLSSAQLAASHPLSGGTYEYGYRWLQPSLGFTAGWMFLCAKIASAATAALGFSGYFLHASGQSHSESLVPLALGAVLILTVLVLSGIRRSSNSNIVVVSVTLFSLVFFVLAGLPNAVKSGTTLMVPFFAPASDATSPLAGFLQACALMFVAYTGYGRIATLAEEVHAPRRTIPLAIIATLLVSMVLYVAVGVVSVASAGVDAFAAAGTQSAAPLEVVARDFEVPGASLVVAIGAVTAMLGVLLNLILGLSRVVLAMARRRDIPSLFSRVGDSSGTPYLAVLLVSGLIAGVVLTGDVKTTWSFSAFTVLIYYAITNLAAIQMTEEERLYPRLIPWLGLFSCLFLAFWVETLIWMIGLALITSGLIWHWLAARLTRSTSDT
ncbi:MAG TPA: APC family permease [Pirellulaceae bacterium]|nr:APC family permease [Pirellulaceae bacterium]HMO93008.1 APC family permease [Pirellulaceae bacterium]HMP67914.1 APC family permease [Pirellulaceae bacterium]